MTAGAGVAAQFVRGEADDQIETSRTSAPTSSVTPGQAEKHLTGVIAHSLLAPGLSPWVGARVGVGYDSDAGLAYTGRGIRVDGRHAFQNESIALSIGLGASAVLTRHTGDNVDDPALSRGIPGVDTSKVVGWGLDVPVLFGWRSDSEVLSVYGGVRAGYGRVFGDITVTTALSDPRSGDLDAWHLFVGPVAGLAVGVAPVYGIVEIAAPLQRGRGTVQVEGARDLSGSFTGLTLAPAAGLVARF
jgi:hypothetical protein